VALRDERGRRSHNRESDEDSQQQRPRWAAPSPQSSFVSSSHTYPDSEGRLRLSCSNYRIDNHKNTSVPFVTNSARSVIKDRAIKAKRASLSSTFMTLCNWIGTPNDV